MHQSVVSGRHCFLGPPSLVLTVSLPLLLQRSLSPREGFDGDIPFRTECSEVSQAVHIVLGGSLCWFSPAVGGS